MATEPATRTAEIWVDRVRADHVGRRVVVRYRLSAGDKATDVLGRLVDRHAGALQIRRADDSFVDVPLADVVAAKPVPERRVTRRDVRALEAAAAKGWRAPDTAQSGRLAAARRGRIHPAGQLLPTPGHPGMPVPAAVAEVERWYATRLQAPTFQVIIPLAEAVDYLDALGWAEPSEDVLVMTSTLGPVADALRPRSRPGRRDRRAGRRLAGRLPLPRANPAGTGAARARPCRHGRLRRGRRREPAGGRRRGAVTDAPDGRRWVGITAVEVEPAARRRVSVRRGGVARWARRHGATDVYLQVSEDNAPALATYRRLGFVEHHRYHYRTRGHDQSPAPGSGPQTTVGFRR